MPAAPEHHKVAEPPGQRRRRVIVFVITALGSFMASLDLSIVNIAFPAIKTSYPQASQASLAWIITAYSIVFGALLVTGGRTGDRQGRKRTFLLGTAVFIAGSFLCGIAPDLQVLVASRVLQAVGAAFLVPSSVGLLIGAYPPARRTQVVSLWGGIGALAVATGPSLGAVLISAGGWRWVFFVNVPIGLAILVVGRRVLVESARKQSAARPDYLGVLLVSLAVAALVAAVSEGGGWGWGDPRIIVAFVGAVILTAAFVYRSGHHPQPVIDLSLFSDRSFAAANAATLVYAAGFFAILLGNILFLTGVWHYSIMRAGLAVTPGPLVVAVVAGPAGKLATRIGFRPVIMAGGACLAAGLLWFVLRVGLTPAYLAEWLPGTLIVGLGIGLSFPVLSAAAVSSLDSERFAIGSAVNQTSRQVGGALGIAVLVLLTGPSATLAEALTHFQHVWAFGAVTSLSTGLIAMLIPRTSARARAVTKALDPELVDVNAGLPLVSPEPDQGGAQ
jgi:EmrB/QacA subfamily drug resistance transporter